MAMATKRPTLRDQLEELRHEIANMKARLDALELVARRPKIARVILPSRPAEVSGGSS
jgi:hypothetical protein